MATPHPTQQQPPNQSDEAVNRDAVEVPTARPDPGFFIVGIGASAGGLASFGAFFSGMPAGDSGLAFVLVQHLAPDHESMLAELLRRYTRMEVVEATQGIVVRPNCVYIIPPNRNMSLANGTLQLIQRELPHSQHLAIDFFFRSLAEELHERAICIVLSGTGSDGTMGLRAVKGAGGMVIALNPASTEYGGMPTSAINTGLVDYVLPPGEMGARVVAYAAHAPGKISSFSPSRSSSEASLKKIFDLLRVKTGHDFSHYKFNTVARCIARRMAVHQIEQKDEYARFLEKTPDDVEALFRDLLIGVTSFFRDPEAFEILRQQIIPQLFKNRPADSQIRVWVPGCATGEEAYSIAILLQAQQEELDRQYKLQVFATDIDRNAIRRARIGVYPASVAIDITPERLERFLVPEPDGTAFHICKAVRDIVVFSDQDVIRDPPFSKLDLISCRNLLIYLDAELQKALIPHFHYALKPGGALFLGSSETVGEFGELFATIDRKWKLYSRQEGVPGARHPKFSLLRPAQGPKPSVKTLRETKLSVREETERGILQHFTPAALLIDEKGEILYLHGRTGEYLEPAPGKAAMYILNMARDGLRQELTAALHKARLYNEPVRRSGLRIENDGNPSTFDLTVRPLSPDSKGDGTSRLFLVILEKVSAPVETPLPRGAAAAGNGQSAADVEKLIAELTQALEAKEEYLQITNEDLRFTNEALGTSNEEMQSLNEELQAANEELQTSKEELQSVNEELATVNAELQTKMADLSRSNNDMNNLLSATGIGTIFVDGRLCIRHFTPAVTQAINLIPADVGRPVGHIVSNLVTYNSLVADTQAVLDTLQPKEVEVRTHAGEWYLLRIRPYRTMDNAVDGAVITFTDITEARKAQAVRLESNALRRLATVVRDASEAITARDLNGNILAWNPAAERMYGWSEAEALAMNVRDLIPEGEREEELASVRRQIQGESLQPRHMRRIAKDGRIVEVMTTSTLLVNAAGEAYAIAGTERELALKEPE